MLSKLLKYDLKWTIKIVYVFLGLGLVFGIVGRLLELVFDSLFFDTVVAICKGISLSLTISGLVNVIIRSWVRLILNMYKDESYLTNTLPIGRDIHYLSKVLNAIVCITIAILVLVLDVFIMYYSQDVIEWLKSSFNLISTTLNVSIFGFIFLLIGTIMAEVLFIIICGYFGIIFGHRHNNKKGFYSFVYGFASYAICTITTFVILIIVSLFSEGLHNIIFSGQTTIEFSLLKGVMIFALVIYLGYIAALYLISNNKLKKGIDID